MVSEWSKPAGKHAGSAANSRLPQPRQGCKPAYHRQVAHAAGAPKGLPSAKHCWPTLSCPDRPSSTGLSSSCSNPHGTVKCCLASISGWEGAGRGATKEASQEHQKPVAVDLRVW